MKYDAYTQFFVELKQYNSTNFKTLRTADLSGTIDSTIIKAFSSVITRYFIFCEKHPELTGIDRNILYYQLKIDTLARYFANYPKGEVGELRSFQLELQNHISNHKEQDVEVPEQIGA